MKNLLRSLLGDFMAWRLRRRSRPYAFTPDAVLVVAPHADDETLGCGGLLALKHERREPADVVFVSDSAGSPPVAGLSARRRTEALAALAMLGVPADRVHFLDAPDGQLNRLDPGETARVQAALAALLQKLRPADIFVPYLGGGSSEHDATTLLVRGVNAGRARLWEYPVWAWWDARRLSGQLGQPVQNFHLPLGVARQRKRSALACHASQLTLQPDGQPGLPASLARLCTGPDEFFFHRPT